MPRESSSTGTRQELEILFFTIYLFLMILLYHCELYLLFNSFTDV